MYKTSQYQVIIDKPRESREFLQVVMESHQIDKITVILE